MRYGLIHIVFLLSHLAQSQSFPTNYFRHPINSKLLLAGTFGELRSYHFHMGIDIKANEGTPVLACADGNLARIKIGETGYGKVLYISHPNGYTTVYAHLSKFCDTLEKFIRKKQFETQCEEQEIYLSDSIFRFKKGELIAWSGNTGHSAGPHLHFEIRDTKTDECFNPLLFGINVKDEVKPQIQGIKFYPITETSSLEGKHEAKFYALKTGKGIQKKITIHASGELGIAIQAHDYMTESSSRCGIYELQLCSFEKKMFCQRIANIGYDVTRYINTYKDFDEFHNHSRHLHKMFIQGNNQLKFYTEKDEKGIVSIEGNDTLKYCVKAKDAAGNFDSLIILIVPEKVELKTETKKPCKQMLVWSKPFEYIVNGMMMKMQSFSTYDDACFNYYTKEKTNKTYSKFHAFYTDGKPVQESFDLAIRPDTLIPDYLKSKIIIARTRDLKEITPYETKIDSLGFFTTRPRSFGTFVLIADTLPPTITSFGFKDSMNITSVTTKEISFEIKDALSGLNTFKIFVNNTWVLSHFNLKKEKLFLLPKEIQQLPGIYPIRVEVTDKKGNVVNFEGHIKWLG